MASNQRTTPPASIPGTKEETSLEAFDVNNSARYYLSVAETFLRLCRFFGLSYGYWLRTQAALDTEIAERALGTKIFKIKPWAA
jgi:hypothetical protein